MKFSKIQLFSILLIPLIYLLLQSTLLDLKGPSWILMPQDLGYNYLFNGLNFLNFSQIGTLIHPALIQIIFHGVLSLIIFTINGTGNFVENVIIYAENYQLIISQVSIFISFLCIILANFWMMDGIRNIKVIFLSQIFIFYATIEIWIMNSFGSPENFVFLCSYLIAGLCVKSLNKPKNYFNNNKFVSISALLCTISATSKLIGLPLLFIPIFMINRFDKRINFLVKFCFFSFLVCLPFFIVMANWSQLYSDLISLFKTVIFENSSFDVKKIIIFYITKFENIFNTFAGLSYFLIFYFILLCINITLNILRKNSFNNLKLFLITLIMFLTSLLFFVLRQKFHYVHAIMPVLIITFVILLQNIENHILSFSNKNIISIFLVILSLTAMLLIPAYKKFDQYSNNLKDVLMFKKNVLKLNKFASQEILKNNIVITAVQANTWASAMDHANQATKGLYSQQIQKLYQSKGWLNYNWNNSKIVSFDSSVKDLGSLLNNHENVYFYTKIWNFKNDRPTLKSPRLVFRTIHATSHELFAKILAFPISNHYSITNKNNSKIWTKNICVKNKNICVDFKVPINFSKCLAYFHIIDSKALLGNTFNELKIEDLKKITIQASNNKSNWKTVYKINNDYHSKKSLSLHSDATSKKGEFILNIKSGFNYYKLIFPKNNKKLIDKEFNFLFKKGCI